VVCGSWLVLCGPSVVIASGLVVDFVVLIDEARDMQSSAKLSSN
jgi:hypothetical protein